MAADTRIRYRFSRPLVPNEVDLLHSCIGDRAGAQIVLEGDRVTGVIGHPSDVRDFQDVLRLARASRLYISVAEAAQPSPIKELLKRGGKTRDRKRTRRGKPPSIPQPH